MLEEEKGKKKTTARTALSPPSVVVTPCQSLSHAEGGKVNEEVHDATKHGVILRGKEEEINYEKPRPSCSLTETSSFLHARDHIYRVTSPACRRDALIAR